MEKYIDEVAEKAIDSKTEHGGITSWPTYAIISMGFVGMGREAGPLAFIPAAGFGLAGACDFLKGTPYDPRAIASTLYQKLLGKN